MTLRGDDRAVTVQVGAVLLFGFLVVALATYQMAAVPADNRAVEFRHGERVAQDLLSLHAAVDAAAAGDSRSTQVELGTRYPARTFFVNPPPASGILSSAGAGAIAVRNAVAVGDPETADYWNGTDREFPTDRLTYRADYNVLAGAPTTVIEHGVVVDAFEGGTERPRTEQTLVRGRTVGLVGLAANVSESGTSAYSATPRAVSPATRTVAVTDGSGPVTVEFRTALSVDTWRDLLATQMTTAGGHVQSVTRPTDGEVRIELETGVTYRLRMARVAVGTNVDTSAAYLTTVGGSTATVAAGDEIAVETRDRFNNPVAGATVEVARGFDLVDESNATTDADGRATFAYDGDGNGTLRLRLEGGSAAYERVDLSVRWVEAGSGQGTDPGHAYVDVDGDTAFDPERGDTRIADSELSDGAYDAGFYQLVVPESVGGVSADAVDLRGDMGVFLGTNVTATRTDSVGAVTIDGGDGDVVVDGGRVEANGDRQTLSVTAGGAVDVRDATVVAHGRVALTGSTVDASRAFLHADKAGTDVALETTGGGVRVVDATLKATGKEGSLLSPDNDLSATVPSGATVYVDGATFVDEDGSLNVIPDGSASGTPANGTTT